MTSKIKVDNINKVSDDSNIIKKCGSTTTVGSGSGQTIVVDGATVTLGRCGGAVNLASGATQSGFGRTGTVDWCSTAKTAPFTAVSGDGFFVNTTSGGITVTLPSSPSAGDIVAFADYANTWCQNAVIICRNGSKINGFCNNATLDTLGQSVTLIYVDGTRGWKNIQDSTSNVSGAPLFIVGAGGTVSTSGDFKTHIFTGDGTFTIQSAPTPANNTVDYFVVAGGGGATGPYSGGGGGGGFRLSNDLCSPAPTMSPLANPSGLPVSAGSYPITVGGGGAATPGAVGCNGSNSIFSTITSSGGGGSGYYGGPNALQAGRPGGSGSGGGHPACTSGGTGNQPPVSPPQGNNGGNGSGSNNAQGGGGGAGAAGTNAGPPNTTPGIGGAGSYVADSFIGPLAPAYGESGPVSSTRYFAGGGGGGSDAVAAPGVGGVGGGGDANINSGLAYNGRTPGSANMGGGGGGGPCSSPGSFAGGSGIVMIRYKFQ